MLAIGLRRKEKIVLEDVSTQKVVATIELDNDKSAINNKSHGLKRLRIDAPENIRIIRAAK